MNSVCCMYLRISKEDGENSESNSISNQRDIIKNYAKLNNLKIKKEYVDDGYSGAVSTRPAFNRMINDLEKNKINTIIVKDLSRFGRNYIDVGNYIQKIFPKKGIRFISINDNYDSYNSNLSDTHLIVPIKNFINDSYCRDISLKIKSSKQIKQNKGDFIGSFPPFGYLKNPQNKYELVIDKEVEPIIIKIFDMKIEGYPSSVIAKFLNNINADTPIRRREALYEKYKCGFKVKNKIWDAKIINRIISNKVYIGTLQQGKTSKISYKSKKFTILKEEDWISKENAHESIISKDKFYLANKMLNKDLKLTKGKLSILSGLMFCKDCGNPMVKRTIRNKTGESIFYFCSQYCKIGKCSAHKISENDILDIAKDVIKSKYDFYKKLIDEIKNIDISKINFDFLDVQITNLNRDKQKEISLREALFTDFQDGLIDSDDFEYFDKLYLDKIKDIDKQILLKKESFKNIKDKFINKQFCINSIINNENYVDRLTLVTLIDYIEVDSENNLNFVFNDYEGLESISNIIKTSYNMEVL